MSRKTPEAKTVMEQFAALRRRLPNWRVMPDRAELYLIGIVQPTSRSALYTVRVRYKLGKFPRIRVVDPPLCRNEKNEAIPHMYGQKYLCLFHPKYEEFKFSDFIADSIIPWISLWLYHYENWHMTGDWDGGGEHPTITKKQFDTFH